MTTTFKMYGSDLKAFLAPLMKAACNDGMLPVLCAVQMNGTDGTLVGIATDRFRAAFHRNKPKDYSGEDFSFLLPMGGAKRLLAVFGPTRGHNPALDVTIAGDRLTVTDRAITMTVEKMEGEFPKLGNLIAREAERTGDPMSAFGINPRFLAEMLAFGGNETAVIRPPIGLGDRPLLAQVTDDLLVLVMQRRVFGGEGDRELVAPTLDLAPWVDLLGGKK